MALPPQTRLTDEERANLVAFLDGEVDESLAQSLEEKAARSASVRREIEALDKTWIMLDWLPRPELPAEFASQTITRIHSQQIQAERLEGQVKRIAATAALAVAWLMAMLLMVAVGFIAVRLLWPDPNRDLVNQLDVVENLETYRAIPDLKFLDDLSRLGIFVEPVAEPGNDLDGKPEATGEAVPSAGEQGRGPG